MRRRPCRRPVISLCNIVLHLLVRHTALLRRLSSHSAHSTHFPFSNRFLEVPCLYTTDGYIFAYIKIEGLNLELYSRQEQKLICRELSAALSGIKRPYKSDAVSRPADISRPLSEYQRLYNSAAGGEKKLSADLANLSADKACAGDIFKDISDKHVRGRISVFVRQF